MISVLLITTLTALVHLYRKGIAGLISTLAEIVYLYNRAEKSSGFTYNPYNVFDDPV